MDNDNGCYVDVFNMIIRLYWHELGMASGGFEGLLGANIQCFYFFKSVAGARVTILVFIMFFSRNERFLFALIRCLF